jgi:hypothetical protein
MDGWKCLVFGLEIFPNLHKLILNILLGKVEVSVKTNTESFQSLWRWREGEILEQFN